MRVVVDLDKVVVVFAEIEDVDTVSVLVTAPPLASAASDATVHRLADVLAATNIGTLEPDGTVRLHADAVRFHAAGQVDEDWERRFVAACLGGAGGGAGGGASGGAVVAAPAAVTWPTAS
ncbi:MAG TPA: hypothetical protein VND62_04975 [Acidimicrobiales bacterium]|nr:hypothetical protein [Acidimicrobiales bacterium]